MRVKKIDDEEEEGTELTEDEIMALSQCLPVHVILVHVHVIILVHVQVEVVQV